MKLYIKNFRAIRDQNLEIAPITVIYGPNRAGKSSVLYALLTLRNIVLNPSQPVDGFFGYGFLGLGNFKAVVFDHNEGTQIELGILIDDIIYSVTLGLNSGEFRLDYLRRPEPGEIKVPFGDIEAELPLSLSVAFPYFANALAERELQLEGALLRISWNGLTGDIRVEKVEEGSTIPERVKKIKQKLNAPVEVLRAFEIVPLKRGFTKPNYAAVSISPWYLTEDEVATLLAKDKYLLDKVSSYLDYIANLDLRLHAQLGTAVFSLDILDRRSSISCELVNEGFGINQLVFLLTKSLRSDVRIVGIEEPEIHLHPTHQRKLAHALVDIAHSENKHFIITTHSESFVTALLAEVARGRLRPQELACYFVVKRDKEAEFERQEVDKDGGIKGGLRSFIEGEMEDLRTFLGLDKEDGVAGR